MRYQSRLTDRQANRLTERHTLPAHVALTPTVRNVENKYLCFSRIKFKVRLRKANSLHGVFTHDCCKLGLLLSR